MPKDKSGKQITWKEFFQRWRKGIKEINAYQQARIIYQNTYLMLFGILAGFVFSLFNLKQLWWLSIILFAAFINTLIVQIGNYQKYELLKGLMHIEKEVMENE